MCNGDGQVTLRHLYLNNLEIVVDRSPLYWSLKAAIDFDALGHIDRIQIVIIDKKYITIYVISEYFYPKNGILEIFNAKNFMHRYSFYL